MIIDCFPFFDELEILEVRLHELDSWVDLFLIVESCEKYSGGDKPLIFLKNRNLFKPFQSKILYLISPQAPDGTNAWDRHMIQRDYAFRALSGFADNSDLILVGDVDEIPRGCDFTKIKRGRKSAATFLHTNYLFYMNLMRPGGWPGTVLTSFNILKHKFEGSLWEVRRLRRNHATVKNKKGWHFKNIGGKDRVVRKLRSSCHYDSDRHKKMVNDPDFLENTMEGEREVKGRQMRVVPIDDSYPSWFRNNVSKFKCFLTE